MKTITIDKGEIIRIQFLGRDNCDIMVSFPAQEPNPIIQGPMNRSVDVLEVLDSGIRRFSDL